MAKYYPHDKFNLTIYETDVEDQQNLTDEDVEKYLNGTLRITLSNIDSKLRLSKVINSSKSGKVIRLTARLFSAFLTVLIRPWLNIVVNHEKLSKMYLSDIIYVYDAENAGFIPFNCKHKLIIGCMRATYQDVFQGDKPKKLTQIVTRILYSHMLRNVDAFHFLTQKLKEKAIIHKNFEFVQNSGTDLRIFYPITQKKQDTIRFLFSGNLNIKKGILVVLEAFKKISRDDVELHICGNGELTNSVLGESQTNSKIKYHGYMQGVELAEVYRSSDILVFPSVAREQHPLVVIEALASGLFVITSNDLKGVFDKFEKENALEYCKPEIEDVRNAMLSAIRNITYIRDNRTRFSELVAEYNWKNVTTKLFDTFEELYVKFISKV